MMIKLDIENLKKSKMKSVAFVVAEICGFKIAVDSCDPCTSDVTMESVSNHFAGEFHGEGRSDGKQPWAPKKPTKAEAAGTKDILLSSGLEKVGPLAYRCTLTDGECSPPGSGGHPPRSGGCSSSNSNSNSSSSSSNSSSSSSVQIEQKEVT